MLKYIKKIDTFLARLEKTIILILFSGLVTLIIFNIVTRNLFNISYQKLLELLPSFVLWLALLGSTLALKNSNHIKLELLLRFFPDRVRHHANTFSCIFGMIIMGILFTVSVEFVNNEVEIFGPLGWSSIIFPLFFLLSFFRYGVMMLGNHVKSDTP